MIAFAVPTPTIDGGYHSAGFFRFQINGGPAECSLAANGENAPVLTCPRHILTQEMLHKTADGCEAAIPGNRGVPAPRFDMIQKREHDIGLDIFEG
jgi:hypothetical protein